MSLSRVEDVHLSPRRVPVRTLQSKDMCVASRFVSILILTDIVYIKDMLTGEQKTSRFAVTGRYKGQVVYRDVEDLARFITEQFLPMVSILILMFNLCVANANHSVFVVYRHPTPMCGTSSKRSGFGSWGRRKSILSTTSSLSHLSTPQVTTLGFP